MAKKKSSKRQILREERKRKERQQRTFIIGGIVVIALIVIGIFVLPSLKKPEIIIVDPGNWPQEDGTALGDSQAPVKIEIFEDFKCSACQIYSSDIEPDLINNEVAKGEVYYVFHQYPFLSEEESALAANASECAAEQNRFWDYKKILYENMNHVIGEFDTKSLNAFAESLGLNTKQFSSCLKSKKYADKVDEDMALGDEMGVAGTPSLFVNGEIIKPGYIPTYQDIQIAIQNVK